MIPSNPLRVVLTTSNEEGRIRNVLCYYLRFFSAIELVDNDSVDQTIEIAKEFQGVNVHRKRNSGTIENTKWFRWLLTTFPASHYLLLSCSEVLSPDFIEMIPMLIQNNVDLFYVNRRSFTDNIDTSMIFGGLPVILGLKQFSHETCRFFSARCVQEEQILIHDNFKSFRSRYHTVISMKPELAITHLRIGDTYKLLTKILAYSREEAQAYRLSNPLFRLLRGICRELLVLLFIMIRLKSSHLVVTELLARVVMHLQIYLLYNDISRVRSSQ